MMAKKKTVGDDFLAILPWGLFGGLTGLGLYYLIKNLASKPAASNPGVTQAAAPPSATPSVSTYTDLESVNARVRELKELFRMGYKTPSATWMELDGLAAAVRALETQGADPDDVVAAMGPITALKIQVQDYIDLENQGVVAPSGIGGLWFAPRVARGDR